MVAQNCKLVRPLPECLQNEELEFLAKFPIANSYTVQSKCICNQILAATNRVVCDWPQPEKEAIRRLHKIGKAMSHYLGIGHQPTEPEVWTAKYSGYKARRYERAIRDWEVGGVTRRQAYVTAFVKGEKIEDGRKDPRMIQARNPTYNVALGNYLKTIEHKLYNVQGKRQLKRYFPQGRLIAKGLNMVARAALLDQAWKSLKDPVALELDCSRFDAHCSAQLLQVEHAVYMRCFPESKELARLLSWQIHNKCFTEGGVRYECEGRRMSGDMNTALGNCVLMLIMLADAFKQSGISPSQFRIIDDGDDCVVLVERSCSARAIANFPDLFKSYGHSLKIESVTDSFQSVTLCGARVIRVGGVRKAILNPARTIGKSRVLLSMKNVDKHRYVATVGQCLLALHSGVPVLQEHALALRRASRRFLKEPPGSYLYRLGWDQNWLEQQPTPVTEEARIDFALAFGISEDEQIEVEEWFRELEDPWQEVELPCVTNYPEMEDQYLY